jgi:hypothetical protein
LTSFHQLILHAGVLTFVLRPFKSAEATGELRMLRARKAHKMQSPEIAAGRWQGTEGLDSTPQ